MSVCLLVDAIEDVTGDPAPINGLTGRYSVFGTFGAQDVIIEVSPAPDGDDWIELASLATNGDSDIIEQPWARIRARTQAGMTGSVSAFFNPFPLSF